MDTLTVPWLLCILASPADPVLFGACLSLISARILVKLSRVPTSVEDRAVVTSSAKPWGWHNELPTLRYDVEIWSVFSFAGPKNIMYTHIVNIVGKANQRVFMMCQLKKGSVSAAEMIRIYKSVIRPLLEYACQVWHSALTVKLTKDLDCMQKWALHIVYGPEDYCQHLARSGLPRLSDRRSELCRVF